MDTNTNKPIRFLRILALPLIAITLMAVECQEEPYMEPQTRILDIIVIPDTLTLGDSLFLKTIIEDSLETDVVFSWTIYGTGGFEADTNSIRILPKQEPGDYIGYAGVLLLNNSALPAHIVHFTFTIKELHDETVN